MTTTLALSHPQEEVYARLEAERRLREAEGSLARLEKAVVQQQSQNEHGEGLNKAEQQAVQEEMITDVKTLKRRGALLCSWGCVHRGYT